MSEDIGITTLKNRDFSEWYVEVILKAEIADYAPIKGFTVLRPYGYSVWENIRDNLDREFKKTGHQNAFVPILIPETLLSKESSHFSGFNPEVYWVTQSGDNELSERLAVRPTSETIVNYMYSKWIRSWRDLPLKINYWNSALRAEIKSTKPFIRTSEFLWQEGHTAHATKEETEQEVMDMLYIYKNLVEKMMAIPVLIGKKSEKEKFVGAVYTTTMESVMPDGRALQMGTSHFLGQNFSKPFDIKYVDNENIENHVWQASWGVSWRLMGALVMVHGDNKGLVLPPKIAPIQVVIIPIYYSEKEKEKVVTMAEEIAKELDTKNIRTHIDKRHELTPGFKYNHWEMRGIPLRIEIGPRDIAENQVILSKRNTPKSKIKTRYEDLLQTVTNTLDKIQQELFDNAKDMMAKRIVPANDMGDLKKKVEEGFIIKSGWCGSQQCEQKIKEQTGADIRAIPFDSNKHENTLNSLSTLEQEKHTAQRCVYCGQNSGQSVFFARAY